MLGRGCEQLLKELLRSSTIKIPWLRAKIRWMSGTWTTMTKMEEETKGVARPSHAACEFHFDDQIDV